MRSFAVRRMTLRGRIAALCAVVGVLLGALVVLAVATSAQHNAHVEDSLNRAGPMRAAGERLSTAVVNQETGIRGYAISGRTDSLEPYAQGRAAETEQIETIRKLSRPGDDRVRASLVEVEKRAAEWRTTVAEPVLAAVRQEGPEAAQALVEAASSERFDALRDAVQRLQADIFDLRTRAYAAVDRSGRTLLVIQIATAVIVAIAGLVLLVLLDRLVSRPILRLAGQVRDVAVGGDYEKRVVSEDGAPELAALAEDIDGMRRQIAAELAEVRQARQQVEWINQQLQTQAEELTRSNRDLEQFAYVASHDLQEPLRKVASFCQLLQRRYAGQLDERADQYIAFAVDGASRMQRLINDLLAFSRIGRLTSGFTDVDLNQLMADVKSQLEARAGGEAEIIWSKLPTVEGEEPLLTTLFVNLVGNSLKFRRPDVPPVVRVTAERQGKEWQITVRDNGIGIEAEFADKVFVIFQRLHARDAYEGTGIGLAIVKKIVEYHGGRIWLDLDVPEGASINFTLPAVIGADDPEEADSTPEQKEVSA